MADDLLFGGFRGPGGFMPAATTLTEPVTNAAGSDLLAGEVVRLNGNATVTRAQANIPANVIGLVGAMQAATPLGALGPVVSSGRGFVLLEPALVPVAGEALWVSATTPGRATNVAPPLLSVYLGIVKDASAYGATGGVIADLAPSYTLSVGLNTLHAAYAAGTVAADQTMNLTDADGGGVVVDGSAVAFTGANAFTVTGTLGSSVVFPRIGGVTVTSVETIAVPAAISSWDAILGASSTLTLTAGFVAPNELAFTRFQIPTITQTAGVAYVVPVTATVIIDGPPAAGAGGGATPTLTSPSAFLVLAGSVGFGTNAPRALFDLGPTAIDINPPSLTAINGKMIFGRSGGEGFAALEFGTQGGTCSWIQYADTNIAGRLCYPLSLQPLGSNVLIGTTVDAPATRLNVVASQTVASAAGAVWNGIDFAASTLTLTANNNITALTFFNVAAPVVSAALALTVTDFYTTRIAPATFGGAGPASVTRSYSLFSEGNTKFGGGMTFKGTDVNAAGPYIVLPTDFFLEVRYTATGAIQINLPSIATVGNGRVIAIIDSGYNAAGFNITVARNGADTINNVAGNYTMNVSGSCLWFKANATTNNWEIV